MSNMMNLILTAVVPFIISLVPAFVGWGWPMLNRKFRLTCRVLSLWCLFIIPVLVYLNWVYSHPQLIGYFTLPFIVVAIYIFKEYFPYNKYKERMAFIEQDIVHADNAIHAGNVIMWLNCYVKNVHWVELSKPTFSYVVIEVDILSRFLYDLFFVNMEQIDITLIVKGDSQRADIKLGEKAKLVESQSNWDSCQDPELFRGNKHIQALSNNSRFFRFDLNNPNLGNIKGIGEIQLQLSLKWKLKVAHKDRELDYYTDINGKTNIK